MTLKSDARFDVETLRELAGNKERHGRKRNFMKLLG